MHAWATLDFALTLPRCQEHESLTISVGAYGKALTMNRR